MRILHVIASLAPRFGGPSTAAPAAAAALARRGHDVEVLTTDFDGDAPLDVPLDVPVRTDGYDTWYYPANAVAGYAFSVDLARALRQRIPKADIVHVHSLYLFHSAAAAHFARRFGVPYVVRPHGTLTRYHRARHTWRKAVYERAIERRNLERAAAVQFMCEREAREALEAGYDVRPVVVPHGVELPSWTGQPASSERIVFLGRLTEKKCLDLLLDAFASAVRTRPNATLAIAGPDDEGLGAVLRAQADALGISDRVAFLGLVGAEGKRELFEDARAFVLASKDENFGMSVVEALAAGIPAIVSDEVAVSVEIGCDGAGVVVPRTVAAVGGALAHVLDEPAAAAAMGEAGRALAERHFSWSNVAASLETVYTEALRSAGTRPAILPVTEMEGR